jgi:hypothetical protein
VTRSNRVTVCLCDLPSASVVCLCACVISRLLAPLMRCLGLLARVITVLNTGDGVSAGWWVGPVRMLSSLCLVSLVGETA